MTSSNPTPPETAPESVVTALNESSDKQLRELIRYAQQLLGEHPPITEAIESRPKEDLVRIEDHGAYTVAVVERPSETGDARGPFAYRVKWESHIDAEGGRYKWYYLGRAAADVRGDGDR